MKQPLISICVIHLLFFATGLTASADEGGVWTRLQEGSAIAIMRHALAPGTGDPADFDVDDCTTQRNLSADGRAQAKAVGQLFRDNGTPAARVLTSQWCRCQETARLLDIGELESWPALNSFFQNRGTAQEQTIQLLEHLRAWLESGTGPSILVTHQVNISALTGQFARSGEILFVTLEGDDVIVLERIETLIQ